MRAHQNQAACRNSRYDDANDTRSGTRCDFIASAVLRKKFVSININVFIFFVQKYIFDDVFVCNRHTVLGTTLYVIHRYKLVLAVYQLHAAHAENNREREKERQKQREREREGEEKKKRKGDRG